MLTPDDLLSIEEKALDKVAGQWKLNVFELNKSIQLLLATTPKEDFPKVIEQVKVMLNNLVIVKGMDAEALRAVNDAHDFGLSMFRQATDKDPGTVKVSNNSKKAVKGFDEAAVNSVVQTLKNLNSQTITSATGLNVALAPVLQHPAKVERDTAWAVNNASNSAMAKVAKKYKEPMCWISERNGCVHCQAFNGVFNDGQDFPKDLTFANKPLKQTGNLYHPPLHPRCRCSVEVGISEEYAEALKRESVRSILRVTKTASESDKVRIEAAERLLAENPVAPTSVKKYSKKKIKEYELKKEAKAKK